MEGAQPKRRRWPWVVGGILLLLIVIGAMGDPPPAQTVAAAPAPAAVAPAIAAEEGSGFSTYTITGEEYARLEEGMTYDQVVAIVGEPGEEMSSSNIAGVSTAMYSWQNWDGSNANVMIQNGRMVMKAQFGL